MLCGGEGGNSRSQEDMLCPDSEALSQFRVRDLDKRVIGKSHERQRQAKGLTFVNGNDLPSQRWIRGRHPGEAGFGCSFTRPSLPSQSRRLQGNGSLSG